MDYWRWRTASRSTKIREPCVESGVVRGRSSQTEDLCAPVSVEVLVMRC